MVLECLFFAQKLPAMIIKSQSYWHNDVSLCSFMNLWTAVTAILYTLYLIFLGLKNMFHKFFFKDDGIEK